MATILLSVVAVLSIGLCTWLVMGFDLAKKTIRVDAKLIDRQRAALDQQAHLIAHLERCNYHLACELYGKERVDRQLREAASRGSN